MAIVLMVENRGVTRFWSIEIESIKVVSLRTTPQLVLLNP